MLARVGAVMGLMMACTAGPGGPAEQVVAAIPGPTSAAVNRAALWQPAWPVVGGVVVHGQGAGVLVGPHGAAPPGSGTACGTWTRLEGTGQLMAPGSEVLAFHKTPVVTAALVERAGWRLSEVVGEDAGIAPGGGAAPNPAVHRGIQVRSVRKVRRHGAPVQAVVGEWRDQVVVALTDRDASELLAGARLQRSTADVLHLATLPVYDIDKDGSNELVVYGDGPSGGLRAVYRLDLDKGGLELLTFEEQAAVNCEASKVDVAP